LDDERRVNTQGIGFPIRPFLFTLDQIATLIQVSEQQLKKVYIHYEGRSLGFRKNDNMLARNIAPEGEKPDWRVTEKEIVRWLRFRGFRVYDRGWPVE
jgi:hypothetical protein